MKLNRELNRYISGRGIKQVYIAEKTGLSPDVISKILNGSRKMSAEEFLTICVALDIDPNMFRENKTA